MRHEDDAASLDFGNCVIVGASAGVVLCCAGREGGAASPKVRSREAFLLPLRTCTGIAFVHAGKNSVPATRSKVLLRIHRDPAARA
jgi:hypothetical protein